MQLNMVHCSLSTRMVHSVGIHLNHFLKFFSTFLYICNMYTFLMIQSGFDFFKIVL